MRRKLRVVILSPTAKLAEQTHTAIQVMARQTGLRSAAVYGGVSAGPQIKALRAGVEIIVACPGRLLDLMGQQVVDLNAVQIVVIDEADRMFDMGFLPDVRRILRALPAERQTLLFSATMPPEIRTLTAELLRRPAIIEVGENRPADTVSHVVYPTDSASKNEMLITLLRAIGAGQALVFTRTKHRAKKLADQLVKAGLSTTSLQGNLTQSQRQKAMDSFRSGRAGHGCHRYRCPRHRCARYFACHQLRHARHGGCVHAPHRSHRPYGPLWRGALVGDPG